MILSDGGDMCITGASDTLTVHKYSEFNIDTYTAISSLAVTDFEMVDGGTRIPLTAQCVRNGQ